jgi:two-component system OmpR family sensor kinase
VLLAIILSGIITQPLKGLVKSVDRVRQGNLETRASIPAIYELGQLAITYNQMLDRISEDFHNQARLAENMRRFAADASHELRSPLSVFRSSVELLDKAYQQNDEDQIPGILTILSKEVASMTRLVDNLLFLARLDQPEGTVASLLHPEEIHPLPFLEEIYERSQLLVQGQQVELVWPTDEIGSIWTVKCFAGR